MRGFAALLALAAAGAAAAQAPAPGQRQVKINVSPAGQAVLKRYLGTPDPAVARQLQQLRDAGRQVAALADAPRLDLVRLQALLRQQEATEAAIRRRGNDRTIAMLRELSEADRLSFVRSFRAGQAMAKPPAGK